MTLRTQDLLKLPPLNSQSNEPDPLALIHFIDLESSWEWFAIEFDGANFFGLVNGVEQEFGMFSIIELEEVNRVCGYSRIIRDETFKPTRISQLQH